LQIFATYIARSLPKNIKALPHPGDIAEPASLAAIPLPKTDYQLEFPDDLISSGKLSAMQLEGTIHAATKHLSWLPGGERAGFFIGDGAGTGKGRQLASVILDSYIRGRVKSIWVSTSSDLYVDATRDLRDLGCQISVHNNLQSLDKAKVTPSEGVLFVTYSTLTSSTKGRGRLSQLIEWAGGASFDGVLVFDEAHKAKNFSSNENQSTKVATAVVNLQKALPAARVVYASATGVSEVGNMAYMSRLGLFGAGSAFPTFEDFLSSLKKKGISFLELLAMDLKGQGFYLARQLSFRSAEFSELEIPLSPQQICMYDAAVQMWVDLRGALTQAANACHSEGSADPFRPFWGAQQRFFKLLCVSMKVPVIVEEAKVALQQNQCVVIGLQSTGEAAADALDLQIGDQRGWVSPTKQILLQFVNTHFPTQKTINPNPPVVAYVDGVEGDEVTPIAATVVQNTTTTSSATPVVETDALSLGLKELMLQRIQALDLPPNFLDELIDKLGGKNAVAEMTGRKARIVRAANNNRPVYEARAKPDSSEMDSLNIKEKDAFMAGKKFIAIVSDAASTGISLHADQRINNQRRRVHLTIELPWSGEKAIQQLGRSHRSNQVSAPLYKLVFTDLGGERRFAAAVARRLQSLGALTRGDRRAASGLDLGSLNYDSPLGRKALRKMYDAIVAQSPLLPPGLQLENILEGLPEEDVAAVAPAADGPDGRPTARNLVEAVENLHTILRGYVDMMGINVTSSRHDTVAEDTAVALNNSGSVGGGSVGVAEAADNAAAASGGSSKDTGDVRRFLNRLLAVPVHRQRLLFNYFTLMLNAEIKAAKQAGSYTEGVSDLPGQKISREGPAQELWKDPLTGLSTYHHTVNVDRGISFSVAQAKFDHEAARHSDQRSGFYRSRKIMPGTGKHAVLLAIQKPGAAGYFTLTRPNTGESFFEMDEDELRSKYSLSSSTNISQIQEEWDEMYQSSIHQCSHGWACQIQGCHVGKRLQSVTILSGSVIRIWDTLERVLMRHEFELNKSDRTMRIVRVEGAGETAGLPLIGLRYPGHLLPEVQAVLNSELQIKLATAAAAAAGDASASGSTVPGIGSAQNFAAMVLNQRKIDEVAPVVERWQKKAFTKAKSIVDFFKPAAGNGAGGSNIKKESAPKQQKQQQQIGGSKRPQQASIVGASGSGGVKKIKKESASMAAASDVIVLVDDDEEEEKGDKVASAVKKEKETAAAAGRNSSRPGGGGSGGAGSLSEDDIEALIAMGFTKSQSERALRMNSSVERAADYLLNAV
jgi:hypothetical protein